jgi:hypothetical protein
MKKQKLWLISLTVAAVLEGGMALAHFGLQYEWSGFDFGTLPRQLAWALLALNFSWGVLVLGVGGLVLSAARSTSSPTVFTRQFVFIVGLFWLIHGIYIWTVPMPLPPRLQWLTIVLGAFPVPLVLLHWIPLFAYRPIPVLQATVPAPGS